MNFSKNYNKCVKFLLVFDKEKSNDEKINSSGFVVRNKFRIA